MTKEERYRIINSYISEVMSIEKAKKAEDLRLKAIARGDSNKLKGPALLVLVSLTQMEHVLWHGGVLEGYSKPLLDEYAKTYKIEDRSEVGHRDVPGIYNLLKEEPFWNLMAKVKGVADNGESRPLAKVVSYIMGFRNNGSIGVGCFDTVSRLWTVLCLAVENGKAQHSVNGETRRGNPEMKSQLVYILCRQFRVKTSPYFSFYNKELTKYQRKAENGDVGPSKCWHLENAHKRDDKVILCKDSSHAYWSASRVTVKEFVKHFYQRWRECEGFPVSPPYQVDHWSDPAAYGWPEASEFVN